MKINCILVALLLVLFISACGDDDAVHDNDVIPITPKSKKVEALDDNAASEASAGMSQAKKSSFVTLDENQIPISTTELGAFPYFPAPDGYSYAMSKQRNDVTKYFFDQSGRLIRVQSLEYFIGQLTPKPNTEDSSELVGKVYESQILAAGGVPISSGVAPESLAKEYSLNPPPGYWKDLKNPLGAQYMQYVIHRPNGLVWIELASYPNSPEIDVTIMNSALSSPTKESASGFDASSQVSEVNP